MKKRTFLTAAALTFACGIAAAQAYPDRPIRFVVPWPAGGSSDAAARLVARHLQDRLKQSIVVDNKPGASGNIGTEIVAKAPADGYTILLSSGPFSINPSLYRKLPFDTLADFVPVAQIANTPSVLVVNPTTKAANIQEFVALAKVASNNVTVATPGNGSAQHLALELLRKKSSIAVTHVPYKGGAPALNDLLGGQVPAMMSGFPEVAPHIKAGKLRALAVTTPGRSSFLPGVPSLVEVGLADGPSAGWNGIHVPAKTPPAVVDRLYAEVTAVLGMPDVREQLAALGFDVVQRSSRQDFGKFVTDQIARWKDAVALSGAQVD